MDRLSGYITRFVGKGRKSYKRGADEQTHINWDNPYDPFSLLLTPGTIRLIEVHPSAVAEASLVATLRTAKLSEAPEYECLSYVWGGDVGLKEIELRPSGHAFEIRSKLAITNNLAEALLAFRLPDQKRVLWVDAICINQADNVEKAVQIPLMSRIYAKAGQVLVWLGMETEHTLPSFDVVKELVAVANELDVQPRSVHLPLVAVQKKPEQWDTEYLTTLIQKVQSSSFHHLLERPWFRRLWIVQEVAVASKVLLFWGQHSLDWIEFETAMSMLTDATRYTSLGISHAEALNRAWGIIEAKADYLMFRNPRVGMSDYWDVLGMLMFRLRGQECTDDRDRVHALWGLQPTSWASVSLGGWLSFRPSYEKTALEIYTEFAYSLLEKSHMNFLPFAGIWERNYTTDELQEFIDSPFSPKYLPSWVPDFGHKKRYKPLPWMLGCNQFSAGERHWPPWIKRVTPANKRCVLMKSTVLDSIHYAVQVGDPGLAQLLGGAPSGSLKAMVSLVSRLLVMAGAKNVYDYTGEPMVDAVARTLLVGGVSSALPVAQILDEFRKYTRHHLPTDDSCAWLRPPRSATEPGADGATAGWAEKSADRPKQPSKEFEQALEDTLCGNVFFITGKGFVGLAPHGTIPGDLVVVVDGDRMPCIVRPLTQQLDFGENVQDFAYFSLLCLLLGPSYAHGCMHHYDNALDWPWMRRVFIPLV